MMIMRGLMGLFFFSSFVIGYILIKNEYYLEHTWFRGSLAKWIIR